MSKHALITGATKGIGRACAEAFARGGWEVTAVARTAADLKVMQEEWGVNFRTSRLNVVVADLSVRSEIDLVPAGNYNLIVLNAAAFRPGRLLGEDDVLEELFSLNVMGNHRLARRLLPVMTKRGSGHLVVIGSTGTDNWKGHMTAYVASKYALRGLFLGWEKDLAGTGVLATLVAPGATLTASWANETPPPDILAPERVAEVVFEVVEKKTEGRVVISR